MSSVLDNVGITIKISGLPEYIKYYRYCYPHSRLLCWWRYTFRQRKIDQLELEAQQAMINEVLNAGAKMVTQFANNAGQPHE